jgi:hypothetical protein
VLRWGRFLFGGLVVCRWGELGLERRRRNRGGEGRQRGHILTFSDGNTNGKSVGDSIGDSDGNIDTSPYRSAISNPSVIPSEFQVVNRSRHRTDLPFLIPRWFHQNFKWWTGHVTDSVGILNGEPVTSLYEAVVLNPSEKITPPKPPHQRPAFFFNSKHFPFVIQSVTTDGKCSSVVTDWITDKKVSVGNFDLKLPTEIFCR